ncbi:LysM peptidoglycan-binding domain-containing protein, partial [Desulfosarcina sp. OttesenSCG-928-G10]|nr:LysM peptidoglycan-binding domain-containing protein [Desulfosarcina sp. OttesenSCG-928-G10]
QKANNLSSTAINIDQSLKIPGPVKQTVKTYAVKKGESPSLIARKHNIPLDRFLKLNNLTSTSTIRPGQIVRVN